MSSTFNFKLVSSVNDLTLIRDLAYRIWPPTFQDILSESQMDYMLDMMYSLPSLKQQLLEKQHVFYLICELSAPVGFFSVEHNYTGTRKTKIHKIYILPNMQGKGLGKAAFKHIQSLAKERKDIALCLNVNKYNVSYKKYLSIGFVKVADEVIDIGNGFIMDDFVLEKEL